jgi:hypothetical protein
MEELTSLSAECFSWLGSHANENGEYYKHGLLVERIGLNPGWK